VGLLQDQEIAISMDGRGAWRDNVFVERLWRTVKYEEVYLRAYDSVSDAQASLGRYLDLYNARPARHHGSGSSRLDAQFGKRGAKCAALGPTPPISPRSAARA
jgi:putative transposase